MEDLFELLVVIAIAVIGVISKTGKNKKKAAAKPAQAAEPITEPAKPITQPAKPITAASLSDRKAFNRRNVEAAVKMFTELAEQIESPGKPAERTSIEAETAVKKHLAKLQNLGKPESGESPVDEHGCIGGSMPVHTAEGESLAEHAEHEHRYEEEKDDAYALRAEDFRRPSTQELRKAIVMAEVLDKPLSLRGRRF